MKPDQDDRRSAALARTSAAEAQLAAMFASAGWKVNRQPRAHDDSRPDMIASNHGLHYSIELKAAAEGRADRLIPLWAQGYLQAMRATRRPYQPLVVVAALRIADRVAEQILEFASDNVPDAAVGVIDGEGLRRFRGRGLEGLNADRAPHHLIARVAAPKTANLFSDLNQWLLKVLLAPELPERYLSAPRGRYRNASELARAAGVSVMSAFRLVQRLQRDGYLHESESFLRLVRREELFRLWQHAAARHVRDVPVRVLLRADPRAALQRLLKKDNVCVALFAAADALHVGLVHGVPPYAYVRQLRTIGHGDWKSLIPAAPGEVPDIILRHAHTPRSIFRGAVRVDGKPVCDLLQVWLDVASHRSRGEEQAEFIRRRVLEPIMSGDGSRG